MQNQCKYNTIIQRALYKTIPLLDIYSTDKKQLCVMTILKYVANILIFDDIEKKKEKK